MGDEKQNFSDLKPLKTKYSKISKSLNKVFGSNNYEILYGKFSADKNYNHMHKSFIPEEVKDTNMNEINKMLGIENNQARMNGGDPFINKLKEKVHRTPRFYLIKELSKKNAIVDKKQLLLKKSRENLVPEGRQYKLNYNAVEPESTDIYSGSRIQSPTNSRQMSRILSPLKNIGGSKISRKNTDNDIINLMHNVEENNFEHGNQNSNGIHNMDIPISNSDNLLANDDNTKKRNLKNSLSVKELRNIESARYRNDSPRGKINFKHYTNRKDIIDKGASSILSYLDHDSNAEHYGARSFKGYSKRNNDMFSGGKFKAPAIGVYYPKYKLVFNNSGQVIIGKPKHADPEKKKYSYKKLWSSYDVSSDYKLVNFKSFKT